MSHGVSALALASDEADVAAHDVPLSFATFDGRWLAVTVEIDTVIDLGRMAPAGRRVRPVIVDTDTGVPLTAAERMALLASDMERIDLENIERTAIWLEGEGQGTRALILAMSFLSASSQRVRTKLLAAAGRLNQGGAAIVWLLTDVPDGAPVSRLTELTALLKPFGRAVFVEARAGSPAIKAARPAKLAGVAIAPPPAKLSPTDMSLWLLQAGRQAAKAAAAAVAEDLSSADLLPMAAVAGFTHAVVRERA